MVEQKKHMISTQTSLKDAPFMLPNNPENVQNDAENNEFRQYTLLPSDSRQTAPKCPEGSCSSATPPTPIPRMMMNFMDKNTNEGARRTDSLGQDPAGIERLCRNVLLGEQPQKTPFPNLDDDWDDWPDFDPEATEDDRPWDVFLRDDAEDDPRPEHGDFLVPDDEGCG